MQPRQARCGCTPRSSWRLESCRGKRPRLFAGTCLWVLFGAGGSAVEMSSWLCDDLLGSFSEQNCTHARAFQSNLLYIHSTDPLGDIPASCRTDCDSFRKAEGRCIFLSRRKLTTSSLPNTTCQRAGGAHDMHGSGSIVTLIKPCELPLWSTCCNNNVSSRGSLSTLWNT